MTNPAPEPSCDSATPEGRALAAAVARGILRLFSRHDIFGITEVPLPNGRRLDIMAIDGRGQIIAVEIKCSRADLLGDGKWQDYYEYCDRYFWAVPAGFDLALFDLPVLWPERSGLIVADAYDAEIIRAAPTEPLAAARRKAETLRFARRAARRVSGLIDSGFMTEDY
ncbi:MAG TPA: MmcB family DNA repair protein [Sphingobium sp.]|uniref:MmcB family DNA repair protein n=1 Tax=Sphingobium sp. TaxID=1912891 RepID=UPI002ED51491